jgi:hypothetical protein
MFVELQVRRFTNTGQVNSTHSSPFALAIAVSSNPLSLALCNTKQIYCSIETDNIYLRFMIVIRLH